ncbi:MAG: FxLD family lanthipeptide [Dactylosporangium sp.]|nr:FxLD family lanthipeptide [Dactylosporangium sp.]
MVLSATSALLATDQGPSPADADTDGFQLDVRIVEAGPAAAALLGSTDDGCDTVRGSDC